MAVVQIGDSDPIAYSETRLVQGFSGLQGLTPPEQLKAIIERAGAGRSLSASLGPAPPDFSPTDGTVPPPADFADGLWVYFKLPVSALEAPTVARQYWTADLIGAALRDAMHTDGAVLYGWVFTLVLPDGREVRDQTGVFPDIAFEQGFTASADAVRANVTAQASATGLKVLSTDVVTSIQPAPVLVLETGDALSVVGDLDAVGRQLFYDKGSPRYEGYYLEIRDSAGNPVAIEATSFRSGVGHRWIRPDLAPRERVGSASPQ